MKLVIACVFPIIALPSWAGSIILQSTTSTANSGFYDSILPKAEAATGVQIRVVAVGTGQALQNAARCDGDVLIVHSKPDEQAFVQAGFGVARHDLMFNDFLLVGPPENPAGVTPADGVFQAFQKIAQKESLFASRGDLSGTHKKELEIWSHIGIDPSDMSGRWYRETGSSMGATLNIGVGMGTYVLTDRATWASFSNKQDYQVFVAEGEDLRNEYGIIQVNSNNCPNVDAASSHAFVEWMLSDEGQGAISDFHVDGQQVFFPNALRE